MKFIGLLCVAFALGFNHAVANPIQNRLQVNTEAGKLLYEVTGNGLERGFKINVEFFSQNQQSQPEVLIPNGDNYADCQVKSVKTTKITDRSFDVNDRVVPFYEISSEIQINSQVVADTGSCLVWIKDDSDETVAIVNYTYYTGY